MNKYVKRKGTDFFGLIVSSKHSINFLDCHKLHNKKQEVVFKKALKTISDSVTSGVSKETLCLIEDAKALEVQYTRNLSVLDYNALSEKYNSPIFVNEVGGWNLYKECENDIIVYANERPRGWKSADIIICENDMSAEPEWVEYLSKRFPKLIIKVANDFKSLSDKQVKDRFEGAKFITFSTTLSSEDWFYKMLRCVSPEQKLIGLVHDKSKLHYLKNNNIEIVDF